MRGTGPAAQLLHRAADDTPDPDLLARFVAGADGAAFAELVRRHGPMVLGVCRRVLGPGPDADDAFQAAFLVLARKAGAVRDRDAVGSYLFGVAGHVSRRLRDRDRRRRHHERRAAERTPPCDPEVDADLLAAVDAELRALPDRYRSPLVACYLEGRTQEQAARDLGWSLSTVRRRLDHGRELLRRRLAGRGVVPAVGTATVPVPAAVADTTARLGTAFASGETLTTPAAMLAQGVLTMMTRVKLMTAAGMVFVLAGIAIGAGTLWPGQDPAPAPPGAAKAAAPIPPAAARPAEPKAGAAPLAEERLKPGDRIRLRAANAFDAEPLDGIYRIEGAGTIALSPSYGGRVKIAGETLTGAEQTLIKHLSLILREPRVSVTLFDPEADGGGPTLERRVRLLEDEVKELKAVVEELRKQK